MTGERRLPHPDTITDMITELRLLWPALPAALPRDTGNGGGDRVHTTPDIHAIPINPAVAAVIRRLAPHMADLSLLQQAYGDAWTNRRLADAWTITHHITRWLGDARTALGLNRPDQPVGASCPRHDQPLTPLVTPGDHGELRYDAIGPAGELVGGWIRWTHTDLIVCRHCDQTWPPSRWLWLDRLAKDADQRRIQAVADQRI